MEFSKENKERLDTLIIKSVLNNKIFTSHWGSEYSIQALLNDVSPATIKKLYSQYKREEDKLSVEDDLSFEESSESKQIQKIKEELETLRLLYKYTLHKIHEIKGTAEKRREISQKISTLRKIKTEKELEELKKSSIADLEKEIEELKNKV